MDLGYVTVGMVLTLLVLFIAEGICTALREKVPDAHFLCGSRHAAVRSRSGCTVGCQCLHYDPRRKGLSQGAEEIAH